MMNDNCISKLWDTKKTAFFQQGQDKVVAFNCRNTLLQSAANSSDFGQRRDSHAYNNTLRAFT